MPRKKSLLEATLQDAGAAYRNNKRKKATEAKKKRDEAARKKLTGSDKHVGTKLEGGGWYGPSSKRVRIKSLESQPRATPKAKKAQRAKRKK